MQTIKEKKGNQKQSKNKKRIDIIREELKDLSYKLSRSELKEIKKNLYNIKIFELDRYPQGYDDYEYKGVKNVGDLFILSVNEDYYKPKLTKSGYDNNYTQYESKGDRILSIQEYLALIEKYLRKLINNIKMKVSGKYN